MSPPWPIGHRVATVELLKDGGRIVERGEVERVNRDGTVHALGRRWCRPDQIGYYDPTLRARQWGGYGGVWLYAEPDAEVACLTGAEKDERDKAHRAARIRLDSSRNDLIDRIHRLDQAGIDWLAGVLDGAP